jgi:hypothetical protein
MYSPRRKNINQKIINLFLFSSLCLQGVWAPAAVKAKHRQDEQPIDLAHLILALDQHVKTSEELIGEVKRRGVNFKLTPALEKEIRQHGRYLGRQGLDDVIEYARFNYRPDHVDETIELRLGDTSKIDYLGFKATYVKKTGDYYLINIGYPGRDNVELRTRNGCEHALKWGSRGFTLSVTGASPEKVTINLVDKIKYAVTPNSGGSAQGKPMPISPCIPRRQQPQR